jgi:permuted papain-like amidase YaeF/Yiix C92 family enzyme
MKKLWVALVVCLGLAAGALYAGQDQDYPPLLDGDLVFQTSTNSQAIPILVATAHPFTHTGLIAHDGGNIVVIEAGRTVTATSLANWVRRGLLRRVAIYRDANLTAEQRAKIVAAAKNLYGRPYDIFFSFNNDAIYCSELAYLAYKEVGIEIGTIQKVSELNFDNRFVKKLIQQRWQRDPECTSRHYDFEQCYDLILHQDLVTPVSIANDGQFERIYSNYPF